MANIPNRALQRHPHPYLTDIELENLLDGTPDSRYSKVKRMIAQGKLLHIKRGLYCLTEEMGYFKKPNLFELAQLIYGPSCISMESALHYHGLIPEAVSSTTSAAGKRAKKFATPLGQFNFLQVPLEGLYTEVILVKENDANYFIAKPWRAICDYVYCRHVNWHSLQQLKESLRIEIEKLPILRNEDRQLLDDYYSTKRISRFLKNIYKELNRNHNER